MKLHLLKGFHYSTFIPKLYKNKDVFTKTCRVKFDRSCKYTINEQSCVNKLWGFSDGLFGVHKNSWRFGWTYDSSLDCIVLWSYIYDKGILNKKKLQYLQFDTEYDLSIKLIQSVGLVKVMFYINNNLVYKEHFSNLYLRYILLELGLYFGGKSKCPNNMFIHFSRLKP